MDVRTDGAGSRRRWWVRAALLGVLAGLAVPSLMVAVRLDPEPLPDSAAVVPHAGSQPRPPRHPDPSAARADGHVVRLHGSVVDGTSRPVAGASVVVAVEPPDGAERPARFETRTDADGRYTLPVDVSSVADGHRFVVRANDETGRVGLLRTAERARGPADRLLPPIALVGGHVLRVRVTRDGSPVPRALVTARHVDVEAACVARAETDAAGRATLGSLTDALVDLRAYAEGVGRGVAPRRRPGTEPGEIEIALDGGAAGRGRDVSVLVFDADTRAPVAGVALRVRAVSPADVLDPPLVPAPTDVDGWTSLPDAPAGTLQVSAEPPAASGSVAVPPEDDSVTLHVRTPRDMRWRIAPGDVAPPPDGTELPVHTRVGPGGPVGAPLLTARVTGDEVVARWVPGAQLQGEAVAPDGSYGHLWLGGRDDVGPDVSFHRPRTVTVHLLDEDDAPLAGLTVHATKWSTSNARVAAYADARETDASGTVVFRGVPCGDVYGVDLRLAPDPSLPWTAAASLPTADVRNGDAVVTWRRVAERRALLRVRVDGRRTLPAGLGVVCWPGAPYDEVRDPERGEVRFRFRPYAQRDVVRVVAAADGLQAAVATAALPPPGGTVVLDVELRPGGTLRGRALTSGPGVPVLDVQHWSEEHGDWRAGAAQGAPRSNASAVAEPDHAGRFVVTGLEPGRYRVRHRFSGSESEAVEVTPGVPSEEIVLDLRGTALVTGRIELPEGVRLDRRLRLIVEGPGVRVEGGKETVGTLILPDLRFEAQVPGSTTVTVRAEHPWLVPDEAHGAVEVTGAAEDVLLRMRPGAVAGWRLVDGPRRASARVLLFDGDARGVPVATCTARVEDGRLSFTGFPPGEHVAWVDVDGRAPSAVEHVVLTDDVEQRLGDLRLPPGAAVRVRVASEGMVCVEVERLDGAPSRRLRVFPAGGELVVQGLAAGRHRVRVHVVGPPSRTVERVVITDGRRDVTLDASESRRD